MADQSHLSDATLMEPNSDPDLHAEPHSPNSELAEPHDNDSNSEPLAQPLGGTPPQKMDKLKKKIRCGDCGKTFKSKSNYKRHSHSTKSFQCSICEKRFTDKYSLNTHRKGHSGNFKCDVCGKVFLSPTGLKEHKKFHAGEFRYECPSCSYKSNYSGNFKRHNKRCGQDKSQKPSEGESALCTDCGKIMKRTSLRRHKLNMHRK